MKSIIFPVLILLFVSCSNEPIGLVNINKDVLDEELLDLVSRTSSDGDENSIGCLRFNYPFVIFLFDENIEIENMVSIKSDHDFLDLLSSMADNENISISYPIEGTLNNGELLEIHNNEELRDIIKKCAKDEITTKCNNYLKNCVWVITHASDDASKYIGTHFMYNSDGFIRFYGTNVYVGTWVSFFIEENLHLNIYLLGNENPNDFWNKDWAVNSFSETFMDLSYGDTYIRMERDCEYDCGDEILTVCEDQQGSGVGTFNLMEYRKCIGYPINVEEPVSFSFYKTEHDATQNTNAITNANAYQNDTNPQNIHVRVWNTMTNDSIYTNRKTVTIEAIPCN